MAKRKRVVRSQRHSAEHARADGAVAALRAELAKRSAELARSTQQLIALGDVGQAVGSAADDDASLKTIVERAVQLTAADSGTIYQYDEKAAVFVLRVTTNPDDEFVEIQRAVRLRRGEGAVGRAARAREPIQVADITVDGAYDSQLYGGLLHAGTRSLLAVPVLHGKQILGAVAVSRRTAGKFSPEAVAILKTLAAQSALALQALRLPSP